MPLPNGEMTREEYAQAVAAAQARDLSVNGLDRAGNWNPLGYGNGADLLAGLTTGQRDARGAYIAKGGTVPGQNYTDRNIKNGIDYVTKQAKTYEQAKEWADKTGGQVMWVPQYQQDTSGEGNGMTSSTTAGGYYQALMPYHQANQAGVYSRGKDWAPMLVAAIMTGGAAAGMATAGGAAAGTAGAASSGAGAAAGTTAAGGAAAAGSYAIPTAAELAAGGYSAGGMGLTGAGGIGAASSVVGAGAGAAGYSGVASAAAAAASGGGMWEAISGAASKMSMADWLNAAGTLHGMYSADKAADAQEAAAKYAADLQWKMYEQSRADQAPWLKTGGEALNKLASGLGLNGGDGDLMRSFTAADFTKDPGYDFRLKEGQRALDGQFSRSGNLLSGAALKAASRFNQDFASNEYGNSYNRFNTDQANKYNRLASLANVGQVTANQVSNNALQTGQIVGESRIGAGNARASGYMGMSNALNKGVGQGYNMYQGNRLMDMWQNRNGYNNWVSNNSSWLADNDMTANELGRSF